METVLRRLMVITNTDMMTTTTLRRPLDTGLLMTFLMVTGTLLRTTLMLTGALLRTLLMVPEAPLRSLLRTMCQL